MTDKMAPRFFQTVVLGGSLAGALDGLDAVVFYGLVFGIPPGRIFQGVASGLLGARSVQLGWLSVALGVVLQFTIAMCAATVYFAAASGFPELLRKPWIGGPVFGLCAYFVMYRIVVPLSNVVKRPHKTSTVDLVDQLFAHTVLIGLPIALMAARSARSSGPARS